MHHVVIREQIDGDRDSVSTVRLDSRRAGCRISAVVERTDVSEHGQELLTLRQAVVVRQNIREPLPLGCGYGRAARCEGLGMLDRALAGVEAVTVGGGD